MSSVGSARKEKALLDAAARSQFSSESRSGDEGSKVTVAIGGR